jgi:hypothetical protein
MNKTIAKVEMTKTDGTITIMSGGMNDKLFARLAPSQGWTSYRIIQVMEHIELTAKEQELKDYCESHDRVVHAQKYGY